ncbi:hypothetical protein ACP8HI_13545 [Paenibacillus sp. FA6]|uniref:hypothetical protein n=1 Tax=Paenibacillus sp. FA6 TaxID=3413029 RepID=UPI003F65BEA4
MKILNKMSTYLLVILCIAAFGLFIYPGIYKYDKLNQKFPVKINRLTGETQVLYNDGWSDMGGYDSAAIKMEKYKDEIVQMLDNQSMQIKNEVIELAKEELIEIKQEVINQPVTRTIDFDSVRNRNEKVDVADTVDESRLYFKKGDSPGMVENIMGTPDRIMGGEFYELWGYGLSTISFTNGEVSGWANSDDNLKLK